MSSKIIRCKYPRIIRHPNAWQFVLNGYDTVVYPNGKFLSFTQSEKERIAIDQQINHQALNILSCYKLKDFRNLHNLSPIVYRKPLNWEEIKHLYYPTYKIDEETALKYTLLNQKTGEVKPLFFSCQMLSM